MTSHGVPDVSEGGDCSWIACLWRSGIGQGTCNSLPTTSMVAGLFKGFRVLGAAGVILFLQTGAARAEETTARGLSSTVYAGAGRLVEGNNETQPDQYDIKRAGVAVLGVWRSEAPRAGARDEERGFFGLLGAGFELEDSLLHPCISYDTPRGCFTDARAGEHYLGKFLAARLGGGYSWRWFEFRVGVVGALPDANVSYATPFVLPDVQLRVSKRSVGWFEVGLGAYDASTNLRPGLYFGGAAGSSRVVRVSAHAGIHLVNGLCCGTVNDIGSRYELGVTHAFSDSLSGGAGVAWLRSEPESTQASVVEGRARLAWAF